MKKITEKIYIIGKEGSLQGNDNDRKDVSKILHSDVSKILNSNLWQIAYNYKHMKKKYIYTKNLINIYKILNQII